MSSFCQVYVQIFCPLLFCFLIIECVYVCVYILDISPLFDVCIVNIFFPVSGLPFLFLNGVF